MEWLPNVKFIVKVLLAVALIRVIKQFAPIPAQAGQYLA